MSFNRSIMATAITATIIFANALHAAPSVQYECTHHLNCRCLENGLDVFEYRFKYDTSRCRYNGTLHGAYLGCSIRNKEARSLGVIGFDRLRHPAKPLHLDDFRSVVDETLKKYPWRPIGAHRTRLDHFATDGELRAFDVGKMKGSIVRFNGLIDDRHPISFAVAIARDEYAELTLVASSTTKKWPIGWPL